MKNFQCSMAYGSTIITSVHLAGTHSKARYMFYKAHFSEATYAEVFQFILVKSLGADYTPHIEIDQQQIIVDYLNETYKVGDIVKVKQDNGVYMDCTIQHPASILGGHTAVIWTNEISGAYLASRAF